MTVSLGKLITSNILNSNLVQDEIKSIALINELQILLRLGEELSEAQQQMLIEIKEDPANVENPMLKLCCSVVLGNKQEAKYYFNKLAEKEKLDFITFPIYKLYQ